MLREKVSPVRIPVYHFAMAASGSHSVTIALGDDCVPPLTQVEESFHYLSFQTSLTSTHAHLSTSDWKCFSNSQMNNICSYKVGVFIG